MTTHIYSMLRLPLRLSLVMTLLLLAMCVDVAAQQPSLSVNDDGFLEGSTVPGDARFVVTLSSASSQTVSCTFATADGTAKAGSDYVATSGTLTFAPGEVQKFVFVTLIPDTVDELQETFFLDIANPQNATIAKSRGTGSINDDDGPTISVNDASVTEGNSGLKAATFTLTLSGPSIEPIAIRVNTRDATATFDVDYQAINLVVIFQPGEVTHTFGVNIIGDTNLEPNETFTVDLVEAFATTIADGEGVGTILNDDSLLILEEAGPSSTQAAAFDALLFTRDPFPVKAARWLNPAGELNTRVIIFAQNLQLNPGETAASVVVNLVDANNQNFDVPAENVNTLPGVGFTQVRFRLPDTLAPGVCKVTIKAHSQATNMGTIRIITP